MLPSASALACRREERIQKAFSVDHHDLQSAKRAPGLSRRAAATVCSGAALCQKVLWILRKGVRRPADFSTPVRAVHRIWQTERPVQKARRAAPDRDRKKQYTHRLSPFRTIHNTFCGRSRPQVRPLATLSSSLRRCPPVEGVIGKRRSSQLAPIFFTTVECLSLYFNRTHNDSKYPFKSI